MSHPEKEPLLDPSPARLRPSKTKYVLVIHGGAGTMSRNSSTESQRKRYHDGLRVALEAGYKVLQSEGEAMDAAVAAVSALEDNILFNSGKGAVFTTAGKNELEASIMLSKPPSSSQIRGPIPSSRRGFGLTLLRHIANPSQLARLLYLSPSVAPHALLSGDHAEKIAEDLGVELVDESYFFSQARWREHRRGLGLPDKPYPPGVPGHDECEQEKDQDEYDESLDMYPGGTVGAVALDINGCICAVTSTGGKTNKLPGRIGDTPVMSAGYWAEEFVQVKKLNCRWFKKFWNTITGKSTNSKGKMAVGISGTGDGDYFIRQATASTIARRVQLLGESIATASRVAIEDLRRDGGVGGVIALDNKGNVATPLNCPGMYRGLIREDGIPKTAIFDDEVLE